MGRWGVLLAAVVTGLSATPVSEYVSSGQYDRDRALAADCSQPWVPDPRPRPSAEHGLFGRAGSELARTFAPAPSGTMMVEEVDPETGLVVSASATDPVSGLTSRTISSWTADSGCQRLAIAGASHLPTLPTPSGLGPGWGTGVGDMRSRDLAVTGQTMFSELWRGGPNDAVPLHYDVGNGGYSTQGLRATFLIDGKPAPDVDLRIQVITWNKVPRGIPGFERYYNDRAIDAHPHLRDPSTNYPSMHITRSNVGAHPRIYPKVSPSAKPDSNAAFDMRTDKNGEVPFKLWPGFRGGFEFLKIYVTSAQAQGTKTLLRQDTLYYPILIRSAANLTHMGAMVSSPDRLYPTVVAGQPSFQVNSSPREPFVLVGETSAHGMNHWLRPDVVGHVRDLTIAMYHLQWAGVPESRLQKWRYMRLNDMSLRYGGVFRIGGGGGCDLPGTGHQGHDTGQEVDLSPYLASSICTPDGGCVVEDVRSARPAPRVQKINEAHLGRIMISDKRGSINEEGDHYHLRFRTAAGITWFQAGQVLGLK